MMNGSTAYIADNLHRIWDDIASTLERAGRSGDAARLVAVSKFHPVEAVAAAYQAGQRLFGENRVQEAAVKFSETQGSCPDAVLHIIGTLQRNKVRGAVECAVCLEAVDRIEVLLEAEKQASKIGKTVDVLLELHTGEESKAGFPDTDALFAALDAASGLPHVRPCGLMTMAPFTTDSAVVRRSFVTLREALKQCRARFPSLPLTELSMGMSNDYKIAIEEGSTLVRIGTAIFGERR
jgi:pyridoxal phosphate enzyme (YggS family)